MGTYKISEILFSPQHLTSHGKRYEPGHWHRLPRRRPFGLRRGHRCRDLGLGHCSSTLISTVPNSEGRCLGRLNMSNVQQIFDRKYGLSTFRMMTPQLTHCLWWLEIINQRRLETHSALMARLTPKNPGSDYGNRLTCPSSKLFFGNVWEWSTVEWRENLDEQHHGLVNTFGILVDSDATPVLKMIVIAATNTKSVCKLSTPTTFLNNISWLLVFFRFGSWIYSIEVGHTVWTLPRGLCLHSVFHARGGFPAGQDDHNHKPHFPAWYIEQSPRSLWCQTCRSFPMN